ncbi:MAG: hypothetical protein ABL891_08255 [Burkholderiales bacterium]
MNVAELQRRFDEEAANGYVIGPDRRESDVYCLTQKGSHWEVCYTERGLDQSPLFTSGSEQEACDYFFKYMMSFRHDHCAGFFRSKTAADAFHVKLEAMRLSPWQDKIPYGGLNEPRYRVLVAGKAIFAVRAAFGAVPVRD